MCFTVVFLKIPWKKTIPIPTLSKGNSWNGTTVLPFQYLWTTSMSEFLILVSPQSPYSTAFQGSPLSTTSLTVSRDLGRIGLRRSALMQLP